MSAWTDLGFPNIRLKNQRNIINAVISAYNERTEALAWTHSYHLSDRSIFQRKALYDYLRSTYVDDIEHLHLPFFLYEYGRNFIIPNTFVAPAGYGDYVSGNELDTWKYPSFYTDDDSSATSIYKKCTVKSRIPTAHLGNPSQWITQQYEMLNNLYMTFYPRPNKGSEKISISYVVCSRTTKDTKKKGYINWDWSGWSDDYNGGVIVDEIYVGRKASTASQYASYVKISNTSPFTIIAFLRGIPTFSRSETSTSESYFGKRDSETITMYGGEKYISTFTGKSDIQKMIPFMTKSVEVKPKGEAILVDFRKAARNSCAYDSDAYNWNGAFLYGSIVCVDFSKGFQYYDPPEETNA